MLLKSIGVSWRLEVVFLLDLVDVVMVYCCRNDIDVFCEIINFVTYTP